MLNLGNRDEFINLLIREELLTKHIVSLHSMCEGLNYFGLSYQAPNVGEQLFTHQEETDVTAQKLRDCLLIEKPSEPEGVATVSNLMRSLHNAKRTQVGEGNLIYSLHSNISCCGYLIFVHTLQNLFKVKLKNCANNESTGK